MWAIILKTLLSSLASMGMALLTETFLKDIIVLGLEKVSKKTQSDVDDRLLAAVRHAWNLPEKEQDNGK